MVSASASAAAPVVITSGKMLEWDAAGGPQWVLVADSPLLSDTKHAKPSWGRAQVPFSMPQRMAVGGGGWVCVTGVSLIRGGALRKPLYCVLYSSVQSVARL